MIRTSFADGWTVGPKLGAFEALGGASPAREVTIPHDAMRDLGRAADSDQGVHSGYHSGGAFEYAKTFAVPEEWRDKSVRLEFEGVYRDAVVFLNGDYVAREPNGYAAFAVSLDPYLTFGPSTGSGTENRVTVEARAYKDSRWYSGAGIYRPVHLVVADPVHIALDGVRITAPDVDAERAIVVVDTTVENETRHTRHTRLTWSVLAPGGSEVATGSAPVTALPGDDATVRVRLPVTTPRLWSVDDPARYELRTTLTDADGAVLDEDATTFGIRTLQLDPQHGLRINGEPVKLRGACIHHDNGVLGAATFAGADDRRIRLLKAAGFNAVRSAHNPVSRSVLDACDKYGVLVMDELTDVWTRSKTAFDGSVEFAERWHHDVAAMVRNDRNHPSVVMYSIGNEILELASPIGSTWGRRLVAELRRLDDTRFITNGINGVIATMDTLAEAMAQAEASDPNTMMANMGDQMARANASDAVTRATEEAASVLDIVGFNYADSRYEQDAAAFPNRVIVGSETFPARIDALWRLVTDLPHVIGDFTWTGWDYLGEAGIGRVDYTDVEDYVPTGTAGPYPYVLAFTGDIDITGHRRTVSFYREIVFGLRSDPYIAVHRPHHHGRPTATTPWSWDDAVSSWSWDVADGSPVVVDVYADADDVELLLDGTSLGLAPVGAVKGFLTRFDVTYRPGELVAVARRDGAEVGRAQLRTAAGPLSLVGSVETSGVDELAFVSVSIADASGTVPCDADRLLSFEVSGGELLGVGTGRPATEESFLGTTVTTYDGRALAVVRRTGGPVRVAVTAEGLQPLKIEL